ncbi:MAG: hypothetical protein GTO41_01035 [Burkholderiales bacterium]|nr:hypothetical protein [Burkholderiales bacterium]
MTFRTFLFCDICNPYCTRTVELRRDMKRSDDQGRRLSDGRAWFEGHIEEATKIGWSALDDGRHVCPRCCERRSVSIRATGSLGQQRDRSDPLK